MVRLRLISMGLAALVCISIVYFAVSQKFPALSDLFGEGDAIKTIIEEEKKAPPPPPPPDTPPPPPPPMVTPPVQNLPQVQTVLPVENPPPPPPVAPPPPPVITNPTWVERPDGADFARYYPERALERERTGSVTLDCVVNANGRISCSVASEDPPGWGFGDAAVRISRSFRMAPRLENGQPSEGGRVRVPIRFAL
ncbi:MAG: energy transducer TonB [Hyphomonadaceae bacterium]